MECNLFSAISLLSVVNILEIFALTVHASIIELVWQLGQLGLLPQWGLLDFSAKMISSETVNI